MHWWSILTFHGFAAGTVVLFWCGYLLVHFGRKKNVSRYEKMFERLPEPDLFKRVPYHTALADCEHCGTKIPRMTPYQPVLLSQAALRPYPPDPSLLQNVPNPFALGEGQDSGTGMNGWVSYKTYPPPLKMKPSINKTFFQYNHPSGDDTIGGPGFNVSEPGPDGKFVDGKWYRKHDGVIEQFNPSIGLWETYSDLYADTINGIRYQKIGNRIKMFRFQGEDMGEIHSELCDCLLCKRFRDEYKLKERWLQPCTCRPEDQIWDFNCSYVNHRDLAKATQERFEAGEKI